MNRLWNGALQMKERQMASFGYLKILWDYGSFKNVGDLGKRRQAFTYEEEAAFIRNTKPFAHFIDPDDPSFFNPENMPKQILDFCIKSGQQPPETEGSFPLYFGESFIQVQMGVREAGSVNWKVNRSYPHGRRWYSK